MPIRVSLRSARAILRRTRDAADFGLAALELVGQALGEPDPAYRTGPDRPAREARGPRADAEADTVGVGSDPAEDVAGDAAALRNGAGAPGVSVPPAADAPPPVVLPDPLEPAEDDGPLVDLAGSTYVTEEGDLVFEEAAHVSEEAELVEEIAEPGAEEGAGAQIRIEPPFDGYDALRAADVVARLRGVDDAELAETELYERAHRARRTVLDAIAREARRRGPR